MIRVWQSPTGGCVRIVSAVAGMLAVALAAPSRAADCNGNGVEDVSDISIGTSKDCNGNRIPDECELSAEIVLASEQLGPLAGGAPLEFTLEAPPLAISNVVFTFAAIADLSTADEYVTVSLPDASTSGVLFVTGATDCPDGPDQADWIVTQEVFNNVATTGAVTIRMLATDPVDNTCTPNSTISVTARYSIFMDCNANGIPDECEADCNENGIPDSCDIAGGTAADCDTDGLPDACETDCNANSVPDDCEIATGDSPDCNENGIPDECDVASGVADCNQNNVPDVCDLASGDSPDCNDNDLPDECELDVRDLKIAFRQRPEKSTGIFADADCKLCDSADAQSAAMGIRVSDRTVLGRIRIWGAFFPDDTRPAADAFTVVIHELSDGLPGAAVAAFAGLPATRVETGITLSLEVPELRFEIALPGAVTLEPGSYFFEVFNDTAGESNTFIWEYGISVASGSIAGTPFADEAPGQTWTYSSDVNLSLELLAGTPSDCDNNGVPDECDMASGFVDCNSNGEYDPCETDCNNTGTPDDCDVAAGSAPDCNVNGVPDECELDGGPNADCNDNDILDRCEVIGGTALDCNGNNALDICELERGDASDCDSNGVPDDCQLDTDQDGVIDACEPPDGDGDGVPDDDDVCPLTPEGAEVDADGCAVLDIPLGVGCGAGPGTAMLALSVIGATIHLVRRRS